MNFLVPVACKLPETLFSIFLLYIYIKLYRGFGASLVAQMVKNLPALQKTWLWSLGREDSLEEEMATHSSVLAWRIPWTEAGRLPSMGFQPVGHN